jgi:CDP-diacylglycerol--glycerol-3-phosphate 3-phosphatidyltransferase
MKHLPNALTLSRIAVTPLCLWGLATGDFAGQLAGTVLFILAAISDYWDGRLARLYNVRSRLGQFLDPLADKVLVLGAFAVLLLTQPLAASLAAPAGAWLPWVAVGFIAARDLGVTLLRAHYERRNLPLRTLSAAKWKTAWQLTFLILLQVLLVAAHARPLDGILGATGGAAEAVLESAFPLAFLLATAAVTVYTGLLYLRREQAEPIV